MEGASSATKPQEKVSERRKFVLFLLPFVGYCVGYCSRRRRRRSCYWNWTLVRMPDLNVQLHVRATHAAVINIVIRRSRR